MDQLDIFLHVMGLNQASSQIRQLPSPQLQSALQQMQPPVGFSVASSGPAGKARQAFVNLHNAVYGGAGAGNIFDAMHAARMANAALVKATASSMGDPTMAFQAFRVQGPGQRRADAALQLRNAMAFGNYQQQQDALHAAKQAHQSYLQAFHPDIAKRNAALQQVAGGAHGFFGRLGMSLGPHGVTPLVRGGINLGSIMETFPALERFGPLLIGGVLALGAFIFMMHEAVKVGTEFRNAMMMSGGGAGDVGQAYAMGIPLNQVAQRGSALHKLLEGGDQYAVMASAQLGLGGMRPPQPFDNQNNAKLLNEYVQQLRVVGELQGLEEQLRLARMLQMEDMLNMINVSKEQQAIQQSAAMTAGVVFSQPNTNALNDLGAAWASFVQSLINVFAAVGALVAPVLSTVLNLFTFIFNAVATVIGGIAFVFNTILQWIANIVNFFAHLLGMGNIAGHPESLDANTKATQDNTAEMKAGRGYYGGGPNAAGAVPGALKGEAFRQAMRGQTINWGGFTV